MGLLYGKETENGYEPSLWHRWFKPDVSGNTLNGLGEKEVRRPTPLYHRQDYWHPWRLVQDMFYLRNTISTGAVIVKSHLLDWKKPAPVTNNQQERSPADWSRRIEEYAISLGVDKVGITKIKPEWIFEGDEMPETYAIILATRMDYESLSNSRKRKFAPTIKEVMSIYYYGHERARKVADWLREQGWPARGFGIPMGTALNILPAAIEAGVGELGKHGSLICKEMGALFRLAYVVTDLPLEVTHPTDIGVDDFCLRCTACSRECPPNALSDSKQLVRGVERWYVDFDKCVPYFNETSGCGICIAACPWSQPGLAPGISEKMLKLRKKKQPHT